MRGMMRSRPSAARGVGLADGAVEERRDGISPCTQMRCPWAAGAGVRRVELRRRPWERGPLYSAHPKSTARRLPYGSAPTVLRLPRQSRVAARRVASIDMPGWIGFGCEEPPCGRRPKTSPWPMAAPCARHHIHKEQMNLSQGPRAALRARHHLHKESRNWAGASAREGCGGARRNITNRLLFH
jgi:hypothetical protein